MPSAPTPTYPSATFASPAARNEPVFSARTFPGRLVHAFEKTRAARRCHTRRIASCPAQRDTRRRTDADCEGCPRGADCDCLVEFILAERDAEVVRFDADARRRGHDLDLDADLVLALDSLTAAGLEPELLAVRRPGVSRAS